MTIIYNLEISMNYIVRMTMVDRFKNLLNAVRGVSFRVVFSGNDIFKQFSTGNEIKDEIVIAFFLNAVV